MSFNKVILNKSTHIVVDNNVGKTKVLPFCVVCNNLLRSLDDQQSVEKFGCCHLCAQKWAYPDKNKWYSGWRPTKDEIKLALKERGRLFIKL